MNLDGITLHSIVRELAEALQGGQISKIYQLNGRGLYFRIFSGSGPHHLVVTLDGSPRVYLADTPPATPDVPTALVMFLRKYYENGRIASIKQLHLDRIVEIGIDILDRSGRLAARKIHVELMGKYSNVIFTENGVILEALIKTRRDKSALRTIAPKEAYEFPPNFMRMDPFEFSADELCNMMTAGTDEELGKWMMRRFNGMSTVVLDELSCMTGLDKNTYLRDLTDAEKHIYARAVATLGERLQGARGAYVYCKGQKEILFPLRLQSLADYDIRYYPYIEEYLKENNILVVRRDTGGGAVYVDSGAVNVCYLIQDNGIFGDFKRTYEPAIKALHELGATAVEQTGRNDLTIEGKKVSGAAMTISNGRVYGGFSLLLDVDYDAMEKVLNPNKKKLQSKGIQSVRARVGSIRPYLAPEYQNVTVDEFKNLIICGLMGIEDIKDAKRYELTDEDWAAIEKLADEKYRNWDWNYGKSPRYNYNRDAHLAIGTVDFSLEVEEGRITKAKIYGDFFGKGNVHDVEEKLIGVRVKEEDLLEALGSIDLTHYFGNVEAKELVDLILS